MFRWLVNELVTRVSELVECLTAQKLRGFV